jgi:two-component system response regulator HydG
MKNNAPILVVDDDIEMTETLSDILTDMGYHVEVVNDGFRAIEKVKTRTFDLILMDIKMPGINGVETFKKIKAIQPAAVVIMMTAYSVDDLVSEALKEGAYGTMYKPIDIPKVNEFIERAKKSILILIVDDDLHTCETLSDILTEKRYHVLTVSSGKEAIKRVQETRFDLVFIDVKMPVMNGLEVYLSLKKIQSDIKVVMMTGYRQEVQDLVEEAIEQNAYTCLYKPLDVEKIVKLVEEMLSRKTKDEIQRMVD